MMKKLVQGLAFILFGIVLVLAAAFDPILSNFWGGGLHVILDLLALILGAAGGVKTPHQGAVEMVQFPNKDEERKY